MKHRVIIAGGGTGGHVYPALAIARALQVQDPHLEVHFVGSSKGLENQIVPREGFPLHRIPIGKIKVGWKEKILTVLGLPWAFLKSLWLLLRLRPDFLLGVGGYASAPILFVGALLGKRTAIWEPNAHPGLANRWLSHFVDEALIVFDEAKNWLKAKSFLPVGMPVRKEIEDLHGHSSSEHLGINVLVFGGSQGARGLNNVVSEALCRFGDKLSGVNVVHQTGSLDFSRIREKYDRHQARVEVFEYLHDMGARYTWADLVICRAGASTIAELSTVGRAALFVPFPYASDDHQQKNAESLVQANAARMCIQKDFTPEYFLSQVREFQESPEKLRTYAQNIQQFHRIRAADEVAQHLLNRMSRQMQLERVEQ